MDNRSWGEELRKAYKNETGARRNISLPAERFIRFDGEIDRVTITLRRAAITSNMQTDCAAFESWGLALKVWCGVKKIELRWDPLTADDKDGDWCHYRRFLYRAEQFRSLFEDWFHLVGPGSPFDAELGPLCLNIAGIRTSVSAENHGAASEPRGEAALERSLTASKTFEQHFRLEKQDRQFPVGLFRESVAQRNRVFPAGKGAIDLVGIGQGTLCLFELKAAPNIPAGILSELMFYTSIMRDVIPGPAGSVPRFQFDSRSDRGNGMNVSVADIKGCERIEAVLLAAQFHPLIGHPRIISILNEAAARSWNTSREKIPVTFRGTRLEGTEVTGYKFAEINSA